MCNWGLEYWDQLNFDSVIIFNVLIYRNNGNNKYMTESDVDNQSPLYSNVDYPPYIMDSEKHSHLLPLQQYILEQAKLSGNKLYFKEDEFLIVPFGLTFTIFHFCRLLSVW